MQRPVLTPAFFEKHALALWPHRWRLGIGTFVLLAFIGMCWPWGLTLIATWFHPEHGAMRLGSRWFLRAPRVLQVGLRWYASLFLSLWFTLPITVAAMVLFE